MKKRSLGLLAASALLLASCMGFSTKTASYTVSGTAATVTVTYQELDGTPVQLTGVALPVTYALTGTFTSGVELWIQANNETATGTVTVTIDVNGTTRRTGTTSAAYGTAGASMYL